MRYALLSAALTAALAGGAAAQTLEKKSETTIKVKDGKDVKVVGCLEEAPGTPGFRLTAVRGDGDVSRSYLLVGEADDLTKNIGHLVEIKGKAVDKGDGELEIRTKMEVDHEDADEREVETRSQMKGDLAGLPFLGVKSVKKVGDTCQ